MAGSQYVIDMAVCNAVLYVCCTLCMLASLCCAICFSLYKDCGMLQNITDM